jgi:hypothetical protein
MKPLFNPIAIRYINVLRSKDKTLSEELKMDGKFGVAVRSKENV